jgi:hypothetical protein
MTGLRPGEWKSRIGVFQLSVTALLGAKAAIDQQGGAATDARNPSRHGAGVAGRSRVIGFVFLAAVPGRRWHGWQPR